MRARENFLHQIALGMSDALLRLLRAARDHRPARFLVVGALNTLFGYSAYLFFLLLVGHSAIALTLGTIVGVIFNFFSTGRIVFQSRDTSLLARFCGVYALLYGVDLIALRALEAQGVGAAAAQALLVLPLAALSYLLQREFVFACVTAESGDA
jgi:putative flippase GtrA